MSIENAILELAGAIRYHADTFNGVNDAPLLTTIEQDVAKVEADAKRTEYEIENGLPAGTSAKLDAEHEAKKAAQQKAMDKVSTGKAEIAAALEKAKAEKEAKVTAAQLNEVLTEVRDLEKSVVALEALALDWDKDVRPALLSVGKDRDALVKLMAKYEVPKGGKAPAEKWADLLAEANAIVAARG